MATPPTSAAFKAAFPEFNGAPDPLVSAKIADAAGRTGDVWGDLWLQGVMYRTADLLAKSPFGRGMRLVLDSGKSVYWDDLQKMVRRVAAASGTRVL